MKNVTITIKELKAVNYSRNDDSFDVVVNFNLNDEQNTINKHVSLKQRPEILSHELIEYVKNFAKNKNKPSIADDFFDSIVIVRYNDDVEEIELKVAGFFRRFNDNIKNYKAKRYTEGFLTKYSTPDGFSMKIN